jgi:hypothetical protein
MRQISQLSLLTIIAATLLGASAYAVDYVELRRDGRTHHVEGKLIVEAQDGGLLVQSPTGMLWAVTPEELVEHTSDEKPFVAADAKEIADALIAELGGDFSIHTTAHYVIAYRTSKAYAQWCGALYERLYSSFYNYWERRGLKLTKPEQPLVAVVFESQDAYVAHARADLGDAAGSVPGYYNLQSNRVLLYDLTRTARGGGRAGTMAQINAVLARPEAANMVANIIHEATHQIAFNAGLHQRLADIPKWLCEGLATYFETPDLASSKGWRTIGAINRPRLQQFRQYLKKRPADSLTTLIADDRRFNDIGAALDAYAEAWSLNYFLINRYPEQYSEYLKALAAKGPLLTDTPEERLADFRKAFGDDLDALDREFQQQLRRLGP